MHGFSDYKKAAAQPLSLRSNLVYSLCHCIGASVYGFNLGKL
jgi:hypothetical protein